MINRAQKDEIISGLKTDLEAANAVFLTNLVGISGNDSVEIRKNVREAEGKVKITRNSLYRLAAVGTPYEQLLADLKGTNALAFAFNEAPAVAKVLYDASKELELVEIRGGFFDGKEINAEEISALAKLPSRDEMLGTLLATFNAPVSAFVRVMEQIRVQKEEGAPAPAEETLVEAAPAEEAKAEEAPAKEAKVEEAPAKEEAKAEPAAEEAKAETEPEKKEE